MGRLILAILCSFAVSGMVFATQPKAQKKHSINHKKAKVKSKRISLKKIASRYGNGPTFEGDPDAIRLSSLLFYGTPYRFGGNSSRALDCSAFVQKVFRANGIELPRDSRSQAKYGYKVSLSELKPGDLLFFKTYRQDVSHVGIYIGNGKMIHAARKGGGVKISSIYNPYYRQRFLFAKRVVEAKGEEKTDPIAEIIERETNR
ncbi:C40 family peptidase [Thermocrinis sp.]|jgi:cell wall-associated NlpC family hydrolase|uniref:C40 family peptidase n=1 Tax=Thermocrinis sp. TaxID=2024383 RepID=UPI00261B8E82|nr:C40 family peptidase [Thermocrinis sp.]